VKLWIDECLSPTLVKRANRRGYWATCNRDRDLLGASDSALHEIVIEEEAVFVTNNESDFVVLCQTSKRRRRPPANRPPTGCSTSRWRSIQKER
jgi:predicted nuclease of predicted toxin-antitoxin system